MGAIMDRAGGHAAQDVRRAARVSIVGRIDDVERRLGALERAIVLGMRAFRGFELGDGGVLVTPDANGVVTLWSDDDSVTISNAPAGSVHVIDLTVPGA